MITHTASPVSHSWYEEESSMALRATAGLKKRRTATISRRQLVKWFGALSTALIGAAALAPSAFGIPAALHPWVFVLSMFWYVAFCAGMFDL